MAAPLPIEQIITDSLDRHAQRLQRVRPPEEMRLLRLQEAQADDWRLVVDALAPFVKEKKLRSLQGVLGRRRVALQILIENVSDPHNAQAAMHRRQHPYSESAAPMYLRLWLHAFAHRAVAAADGGGAGRAARAHR